MEIGKTANAITIDFSEFTDEKLTEDAGEVGVVKPLDASEIAKVNTKYNLTEQDVSFLKALESEYADIKVQRSPGAKFANPVGQFFSKGKLAMNKLKAIMGEGNMKLSDAILIFDLPAGRCEELGSCPFKKGFCPGCYAKKSEIQYVNTFQKRNRNYALAKKNLDLLEKLLRSQYEAKRGKVAISRIHSAGDFFSQDYVDMWGRIINDFKDILFYAYTKTDKRDTGVSVHFSEGLEIDPDRSGFDFSKLIESGNFAIIPSYIKYNKHDDAGNVTETDVDAFNYGDEEYIRNVAQTYPNNNLKEEYIVINDEGQALPLE